jgi:hypothetical protein
LETTAGLAKKSGLLTTKKSLSAMMSVSPKDRLFVPEGTITEAPLLNLPINRLKLKMGLGFAWMQKFCLV